MNTSIKVMLVDDSAVIRGALAKILEEDSEIEIVASVKDGQMAVDMATTKHPDVIVLDVEMPIMDGLTALPLILQKSPKSKVVMFSSLTAKGADVSMKALSLGAVECVVKPQAGEASSGSSFQKSMISLLKGIAPPPADRTPAGNRLTTQPPVLATAPQAARTFTLHQDPLAYSGPPSIVAIASSTGGPQALFKVTKHFSNFNVPIVITQHMPATFTRILAEHIEQQTGIPAHEGAEGMPVKPGEIYVAPGGYHMVFEKTATGLIIKLDEGAPENFCKPSVDPMMRSLVGHFGNRVLYAVLTGMGNDGLNGGKLLVEAGGRMIAQDEESSVVWGMPGAVAQAGICTEVLPVDDIGPWIRKSVLG